MARTTHSQKLLVSAFLALGGLTASDSFAVSFDPATCVRQLQQYGFTVCQPAAPACVESSESPMIHNHCSQVQAYAPMQLPALKNNKNGEVRVLQSPQDLSNLMKQDPDWQPFNCYCCCT